MHDESLALREVKDWVILIVDDDPDQLRLWEMELKALHYNHIEMAGDYQTARERLFRGGVDLVVTDVHLQSNQGKNGPEYDEYDVKGLVLAEEFCRWIPFIIITADRREESLGYSHKALSSPGDSAPIAVDYVRKSDGSTGLVNAIAHAPEIQRGHVHSHPPYPAHRKERHMILTCAFGTPIGIHCGSDAQRTRRRLTKMPIESLTNGQAPVPNWHKVSKSIGMDMYRRIFGQDEVAGWYDTLMGQLGVEQSERLHLRIAGDVDFLRVPLECLHDNRDEDDPYLVRKHPFARSILRHHASRAPISPEFLTELRANNRELRVLLIASDTTNPPDPDIDGEIADIEAIYKRKPDGADKEKQDNRLRLRVRVNTLSTDEATRGEVERAIIEGNHHIIHFAGHSGFYPESPEDSGFCLWTEPNRGGCAQYLPVAGLQGWLRRSTPRFFYVSGCESAQMGTADQREDNDFLGIMHAIWGAGVPALLGFRWLLPSRSGRALANAFYTALIKTGELDSALLAGRQAIDRADPTWLSPVLVVS